MDKDIARILVRREQIAERVAQMAEEIGRVYHNQEKA
jgi:hypoxanthine-guanine phosphoribosyltransferase